MKKWRKYSNTTKKWLDKFSGKVINYANLDDETKGLVGVMSFPSHYLSKTSAKESTKTIPMERISANSYLSSTRIDANTIYSYANVKVELNQDTSSIPTRLTFSAIPNGSSISMEHNLFTVTVNNKPVYSYTWDQTYISCVLPTGTSVGDSVQIIASFNASASNVTTNITLS